MKELFVYKIEFITSKELFDSSSQKAGVLKQRVDELKASTQILDAELKVVRVNEAQSREDRAKTDSKLKTLQELVNNHEGFKADIRNILKNDEYSKNLKGVFADKGNK